MLVHKLSRLIHNYMRYILEQVPNSLAKRVHVAGQLGQANRVSCTRLTEAEVMLRNVPSKRYAFCWMPAQMEHRVDNCVQQFFLERWRRCRRIAIES